MVFEYILRLCDIFYGFLFYVFVRERSHKIKVFFENNGL